jgi:hypothetical protein
MGSARIVRAVYPKLLVITHEEILGLLPQNNRFLSAS